MRLLALSFCLVMVYTTSLAAAPPAKNQSPAEKEHAAKMAKVDAVAKQVFTQADRNHSGSLSKTELPTAEEGLYEGIYGLGMQNVLGALKNGQINKDAVTLDSKSVAAAPNLSKKKAVTLSEFQQYAHSMASEADMEFAQARLNQEQLQKQSRNRRGRQVRVGSPVFINPY